MGFQQGLSGLNVSSRALDVIGNNVANANTVGFKSATAQFADVYAASLSGGGTAAGIGSSLAAISQQFTQGNITSTNSPLDMAVNGAGFFRLSNNGVISYTRNGQYQLDKDGYIVNNAGLRLTGYTADDTGAIVPGDFVDLQVSTTNIAPQATTSTIAQVNLDSRNEAPTAMTQASILSGVTAAGVTIVADTALGISVDGGAVLEVAIPAGGPYTASELQSLVNSAINDALEADGQTGRVSVTLASNGSLTNVLQISSNKVGNGSNIVLSAPVVAANDAAPLLFGAAVTAGSAQGLDTTPTWPDADPLTADDQFTISVDNGALVTVTVTGGDAATLQTDINNALAAAGQSATVTVSALGTGELLITSDRGANGAGVALGSVSGNTGYTNLFGSAVASTAGGDNFSTSNVQSYSASTAQTVYDSLGNPHNMTMYFVKADNPGTWYLYLTLDGLPTDARASSPLTPDARLNFNSVGTLTTSMPLTGVTFTLPQSVGAVNPLGTGATVGPVTIDPLTIDFTGTTQYGIAFGVNNLTQDGYTSGRLAGLSVSPDGTIQGRYSNGKTRNMGQLVLANFNNPNGLQSLGGNLWAETSESGLPTPGSPGSGSLGVIQSGAVEESNIDLTAELVSMITQQRVYQANAQTIKTQDQILQTLVNLR